MVYILFDNPADRTKMRFLTKYMHTPFKEIYPEQKCNSIKSMIKECQKCIDNSGDNDTIVCWYDFMGILCWWLCKLKRKKRKIIVLNILLKKKETLKNKVVRRLYRIALHSKNLEATVTSKEYGKWINNILGINKEYTILHDIYFDNTKNEHQTEIDSNSVFCGGRNGRDWEFYFELAASMPDVTFKCVMPQNQYEEYKVLISPNVQVKYDIPENEFLELLNSSQLVVMPLDTEAPAGLIALFQAATYGKMVITTDTVTTREYFSGDRGVLCKRNIKDWEEAIRYYLGNIGEAKMKVDNLVGFLEEECSESKYAEVLERLIRNE
ncbi:glycosyltransferase [Anaerostipes hadrus]|uniref:glycosyltransferase n=1 Tax=Anaerostipes hadrus TaxID=649756 RepID=UPI0032C08705